MKPLIYVLSIILFSSTVNADLLKSEFANLSVAEQDRLFLSSYKTAYTLLAFAGISDNDAKSGPREMFACMKDRDVIWLRKTYMQLLKVQPDISQTFSQNLSLSIAWKCGLITSFAK